MSMIQPCKHLLVDLKSSIHESTSGTLKLAIEDVCCTYNMILSQTTLFSRVCGYGLAIVHAQCMAGIVAMIYLTFNDASDSTDGDFALFTFVTAMLGCSILLASVHGMAQELLDAVSFYLFQS